MKRAWIPKDKGWGMSNLGYGERPMFYYLMVFYLCCLSPFVSSNLVNLFNASPSGWGGVIAEVVVVVVGCQPYPFAHST